MTPGIDREGPPRFSVAEFARWLIAPDAGEQLAPLRAEGSTDAARGPGAIVLDLDAPSSANASREAESLLDQLPLLPCVTIALGGGGRGKASAEAAEIGSRLRAACDVAVDSESEVETLWEGFADTPIAALAFAQLLRDAPNRTVQAGLVAESFVYSTLQAGGEFRQWLESRQRRRRKRRKTSLGDEPVCRMERDRGRLDVRLTRAEKHNAFSRAMRDGLCEAFQLALSDPTLTEVVLSGEGPSFCSGGDLDEFGSFPDPAEAHAIRTTRSPASLLSRLGARARVEVHGACIGAGVELPAFAPHVAAREDAFFQLPEVGLGLVPGAGGTASLPRRIGRQRTAWLGLSGARIDARTALDWGLIDEVRLGSPVEPDEHQRD